MYNFVKLSLLSLSLLGLTACTNKKDIPVTEKTPQNVTATEQSNQDNENNNTEATLDDQVDAYEQTDQLEVLKKQNIVYFEFDKYNISPEYAHILDAHAELLKNNPSYKVLIEGHTDEKGTPEYNIALGERRAHAVSVYLQDHGVSEQQITVVSYGEERPIATGHDKASHAKNRRAVLVY